jgi:hypothetical protein
MSDAYEQRYSEPKRSGGGGAMKWILGLGCGCLSIFLVCGAGCGGCFYWLQSQVKGSAAYVDSLERIKKHPDVIAELGQPIEPGMWASGRVQKDLTAGTEEATIFYPIKGPKGEGIASVSAKKSGNELEYRTLDVTIAVSNKKIDLLKEKAKPESKPPAEKK